MGYQKLPPKAANDPLGPGTMNVFRQNQQHLRAMIARDHLIDTGEHNAWEVARVCRRITSAPAVSPSSSDITTVTNPSTGRYVLTLASGRFTEDMRIRLNPLPEESVKPLIATYQIVSDTSVEVYIKKLTSTLGSAGNAWAAVNTGFDISIHSQPLEQATWPHGIGSWGRNAAANGYGLSGGGNNTTPFGYSAIVRDSAQFYARLTAEHTSSGEHNVRQVAKGSARIVYDGSTYKCFDAVDPFSYTRVSTGIIQVNHSAYTTPVSGFVCPDFERNNGGTNVPTIINCIDTSATRTTVSIYKWDAANSWWQVADADFWIDLHQ